MTMYAQFLYPFTEDGRLEYGQFYAYSNDSFNWLQVPLMILDKQYRRAQTNDFDVIGIDYKNKELTLFLVVPRIRGNLDQIQNSLGSDDILRLMDQAQYQNFEISLPKFEIDQRINLKDFLRTTGINKAFQNGGNFNRLSTKQGLFLNEAYHEALFKVNELGTEAGAFRTLSIVPQSGSGYRLAVDSPFLFLVRHNLSKLVLFMGRICDPTAKGRQADPTFIASGTFQLRSQSGGPAGSQVHQGTRTSTQASQAAQIGAQTQVGGQAQPGAQIQTGNQTGAQNETQTSAQVQTGNQLSQNQAGTQTGIQFQTANQLQTGSQNQIQPGAQAGAQAGTPAGTQNSQASQAGNQFGSSPFPAAVPEQWRLRA